MTGRLLCSVALVAHVFVLVICTDPVAQESSPTSETSPFDDSTNDISLVKQKKKCHRVKKCPKNEEYSHCSQLVQRAQYCSEKGQPYQYSEQDTTSCKQACVCKENYLRDDNGNCIPAEKCPTSCGDNEVLAICPTDCASDYCPTEETKESTFCEPQEVCPPPACKCAFNHRRASNGTCIPTRSCPPFDCSARPNEEFDPCPPLCPTDDCSQASPTGECPRLFGQIGIVLICNPQCRCKKGYWRLNGECVPYGQCPGVCPANERYSECIQGECRALNCTQKDQSVACVRLDPQYCLKGCVCEEGYLRDENGVCVPQDQCKKETEPTTCPPNEQFTECTQIVCRAQKCEQKNWPIPCPGIAAGSCIKGCVCQVGYLRDDNGDCIPEDQCIPNPCLPSEEFSNCTQAVCRAQNCSDKDIPQACPSVADGDCKQGCVCQEGSLRDESGYCVPERLCRLNTCLFNEEWSSCVQSTCRAQNCTQKGLTVECPNFNIGDCTSGCICKENYLRDESGFCVPEQSCEKKEEPTTCPPNEEFSKCFLRICRAQFCQDKGQDIPCPDIPEESCLEGCVCKEGYLRNKNGECIAENECSADLCTTHEEFSNCTQAVCRAQNCTNKGIPQACPSVADGDCKQGCICKEGYFRNENGYCVPEELCNKECGTNQELRCMNSCPPQKTCSTRRFAVTCPPSPYVCKCVCKPGHVKDDNGQCIPEEQCAGPCSENEVFSNCTQAVCRTQNCSDKDILKACPSVADGDCIQGCVCQEGYFRDVNGYCIPEDLCSKECGKNQELRCVQGCPPEVNCGNRGIAVSCAPSPCDYKCVCKPGLIKDDNDECILEEQCDKLCPQNEEWSECVEGTCRHQNCTQKGMPLGCPELVPGACKLGCICKENYLRDESGSCVPEEECDEEEGPKTCPPNEDLVDCANALCRSLNCNERGILPPCPSVSKCIKDCVCKYGYLRDENGVCVPKEQCPVPTCPSNEQFLDCTQVLCRAQFCTDKGGPVFCPSIPEGSCEEGCVCKEGYLRDDDGNCVAESECKAVTCPPNEEFSECANAVCRPLNCTHRGLFVPCPQVSGCDKECICKEGFLRDKNGDCVPEDQCPPQITCSENEVLDACPSKCTSDYCPKSPNEKETCLPLFPCTPACRCRFNEKRAENGTCIPTSSCPPFDCSDLPNEEYVACPPYCPTDECGQPRLQGRCPFRIGVVLECFPKCQCKEGYGRVNGTCIPFEQCPDLCPTNEEYSPCVEKTCRPQNCSERDTKVENCSPCTATPCHRGCVCKENYYRNEKGDCVPSEECEAPLCPNANEVYTPNFKECPPNTCNSLVAKYKCDSNQKEGPGCLCAPGYLRLNTTSPCIPLCDCPQMASSPDCLK
ncbi:hypothetical protein B5X24_HaOG205635 [Helicoverpa armigera]|uniref:TIL domain-containing protein n=1 Tax=Helicoverpa armigera TaxID=29058 RepID=A0A2W1BQG2_HELAM|nr:hypothetical protein B5X24_HaOG205635 [Helicoverpa armigera]